jgi:tetratricopeptide (TPR) repeat protein
VAALERSHWLGTPIDTTRRFRSTRSMPLMRNKNQLVDYLHRGYYLAEDQLYRVQEGLRLAPVSDVKKRRELRRRLARFKTINQYVTKEDRLYSSTVSIEELPSTTPLRAAAGAPPDGSTRTAVDSVLSAIRRHDLTPPEQFQMARQQAFDGQYELARAVAKRLLEDYPDYHDVRLLLGRTYAWSRAFDRARRAFREVLRRDSTYYDAYNALADTELWAERPETALQVISEGLTHHPDRPDFLVKKAKALLALERTAEAKIVVSRLERVDPHNAALSTLTERLNP